MQLLDALHPCQPVDAIATVVSSIWLTPTIKTIGLSIDNPEFAFLPGQAVWPKFERDGRSFSKIYSMASCPSRLPEIELCVSRVGWSSAYLQDLAIGESLPLRGPYGLLTLDQRPPHPRLYLAEGSGIAPLKSHIDWLYSHGFDSPVCLMQANPETPGVLPYEAYWRSLSLRWPQFHYLPTAATTLDTPLFQQSLLLSDWDIDICAVGKRVSQLQDVVLALGAVPGQIRLEAFFAFR
jgi:ferredoxin-NADP reductase